jgi:hypothetical protein
MDNIKAAVYYRVGSIEQLTAPENQKPPSAQKLSQSAEFARSLDVVQYGAKRVRSENIEAGFTYSNSVNWLNSISEK